VVVPLVPVVLPKLLYNFLMIFSGCRVSSKEDSRLPHL
jgi:hypothetical protein